MTRAPQLARGRVHVAGTPEQFELGQMSRCLRCDVPLGDAFELGARVVELIDGMGETIEFDHTPADSERQPGETDCRSL